MIRRSSARQTGSGPLLKGKATAFAVFVCGAGLTYLAQLVLARVIGMAAYGTYAYVLGIVTLLAYLAALGFDVSLLRFLPAYKSQQQWGLMRDIVVYSERNATCAGVVIAVLGLAAIVASGHASRHGTILTFAADCGLVPVYALLWIRCARVRAFGGVASALIPDRAVRDGFVLAAILLAALLPAGAFGAPTAMAITLLGGIAGLGMVQAIRHQRTLMDAPARLPAGFSEACRGEVGLWRRSIFPLVAIALAEVTINRAGTLALTWAGSPAQAGAYALAFNLSAIVILPRVAVNTQFAPVVADRFACGDTAGVQALLNHANLWAMLAAAGLAGVL
jgi:O-antigen/teichoic acid export membrane protein